MNKSGKRFVGVLLAVLMLAALSTAALADGYTYTVRIFSGEVGTFSGQTVITYTDLPAGSTVTFDPESVQLPADSPYYVRGIRESGRDNNTVSSNTIPVQSDVDYVVAYGIKGELVAYTVNYVDEAGNTLAPSETYYGNEGDKPVVAYLYIDGYEPQAYNLTRTLSGDPAANVFTFVYSQIILPTPIPAPAAPTPVVYEEPAAGGEAGGAAGGAAVAGGGAAAGGAEEIAPAPAPAGEAAEGGEEEAGGAAAGTEGSNVPEGQGPGALPEPEQQAQEPVDITGNDTPLNNGPAEIIDLDDTPSGEKPEIKEKPQTEIQQERARSEQKFYIATGLLGVSLIAIAALVVLLVKKRGVKQ